MSKLFSLVMMQLKDKVDFSYTKSKKQILNKIVFSVAKFLAVAAVSFAFVFLCRFLGVFSWTDIPAALVLVVAILFVLSVASCTAGLVKTMYLADDNKVLVTFPLSENVVFISKLLVFYFYELIRNFYLLLPIMLGFLVNMLILNMTSVWVLILAVLPLVFYAAIPVLSGALLSIPAQYIARFFKRFKIIGYAVFALIVGLIVYLIVSVIAIIPENINIAAFYQSTVQPAIHNFLVNFRSGFSFIDGVVAVLIGKLNSSGKYAYNLTTFLTFLAMVGVAAALFGLVFVTTRFFFYRVMRKSFEHDKFSVDKDKKNKVHSFFATFLIKELRLSLRSSGVVLNFVTVYVIVPILVFLMNKVFSAIDTSIRGDNFAYAFNVMTMTLPLLASNAMLSSAFSKEGRAAYIKKTNPLSVIWPLTAKIVPNLVASAFSVAASVAVFSYFNEFAFYEAILLAVGVFCLHAGHMFISATLDIMRPMNEQYATEGEVSNNKNEGFSTILAFVMSAVYAAFTFVLFRESVLYTNSLTQAFIKMALIGAATVATSAMMFVFRVNAYYYDR
ncbi:MAG: hypothetical protein ILP02_00750 [Clostridia bacterium]|nr:hypothetical protein [Clostridia bacterium]